MVCVFVDEERDRTERWYGVWAHEYSIAVLVVNNSEQRGSMNKVHMYDRIGLKICVVRFAERMERVYIPLNASGELLGELDAEVLKRRHCYYFRFCRLCYEENTVVSAVFLLPLSGGHNYRIRFVSSCSSCSSPCKRS